MTDIPKLPLRPQGEIPILGFGTWRLTGEECQRAVETALSCGYRHIDTADMYGNHKEVGEGIKSAAIPRESLFLTTKVWRDNLQYDGVIETGTRALKELQVDYLDLLLVHWPNNDIPMEETFRGLNKLIDDGVIRAAGVSNFTVSRLERALVLEVVPISNNQVEYHPLLNQRDLHEFCKARNVVLTAYSPLAQGQISEDAMIGEIAGKYGKSPAQIAIRWLLQRGIVTIPKASSRAHIESNLAVFDFELSSEDFGAIDTRKEWKRLIQWEVGEFDK